MASKISRIGIGPTSLLTKSLIGPNAGAVNTDTVCPSLTTSAKLAQIDRAPSVTTRNEMCAFVMRTPLISPIMRPKPMAAASAGTRAQSACSASPKIIAVAVVAEAVDRSMPPEITTNVAPIASTKITLLDLTMFIRLSHVRNTGSVIVR